MNRDITTTKKKDIKGSGERIQGEVVGNKNN